MEVVESYGVIVDFQVGPLSLGCTAKAGYRVRLYDAILRKADNAILINRLDWGAIVLGQPLEEFIVLLALCRELLEADNIGILVLDERNYRVGSRCGPHLIFEASHVVGQHLDIAALVARCAVLFAYLDLVV